MKRIAIVVQRYGVEVNGGSEQHARRIAERLIGKYEITVLTTTSITERWDNSYNVGVEVINGVKVKRFESLGSNKRIAGPYCPSLIEYISENKNNYEAFLFMTYLFYPTIKGMPLVKGKAIFFPTAHDEPDLYRYILEESIFRMPKDILFNSVEEQQLVQRIFKNEYIRNMVVGEGVDTPEKVFPEEFKKKWNLKEYIVYVGRCGRAKRCDVLIQNFIQYKKDNPGELKLVIVGKSDLPPITNADIVFCGFTSDQEKFDAMAGAKCLVMPSLFESLCMAVVEALSVGTPVIVNGECAVLREHCHRGNCGLYYRNYEEFSKELNYILNNEAIRKTLGNNGKRYAETEYTWDKTINRIDEIMKDYN